MSLHIHSYWLSTLYTKRPPTTNSALPPSSKTKKYTLFTNHPETSISINLQTPSLYPLPFLPLALLPIFRSHSIYTEKHQ